MDAFAGQKSIVVPQHAGQRGNPVIFGRAHFAELERLTGDKGARELLSGSGVTIVEMESDAVLKDIDTPEALA
jgi:molybdenum cofactor cytidylyltransferase